MKLQGKGALVTGGASGLGRATAGKLRAAGAGVVIMDLPASAGAAVAGELGARFYAGDVTSEPDARGAVACAVESFGGLHLLVNCAGGAVRQGPRFAGAGTRVLNQDGTPFPLETLARVIEVNLLGTLNVIRFAAARMVAQDPHEEEERGVIVNTSSIAALDGMTGPGYTAAKGGVAAVTLAIARELSPWGIRCAAIAPGAFDTPLYAAGPEDRKRGLIDQTPYPRRLGHPEEFAALVQHIAENPMINGEVIRLDGGLRVAR